MPTAAIDLQVSPPITYLKIAPGQKKTHTLTIEQMGSIPLEITPRLVDFTTDGKTGQPVLADHSEFTYLSLVLPEGATGTNLAEPSTFRLDPGQKKTIALKFTIPETAAAGEFPLTVLFKAQPVGTLSQSSSQTGAMLGSNIIVLISDSTTDQSSLAVKKIQTPWLVDSILGKLNFTVTAENTGSNAGVASGSAVIRDWSNTVVAEFPVHPDMVLAQSTRQLRTAPLPESPTTPIDPTTISDHFSYNPAFLVGPYTIEVSLFTNQAGTQNVSVLSKKTLAIPYSLLALILVIMLIVAVFESKLVRKRVQALFGSHS